MYRRSFLQGLNLSNYQLIFGSLYTINALLPPSYRVKISNEMYEEKMKVESYADCLKCEKRHKYAEIKILQVVLPLLDSVLSKKERESYWICTGCKAENLLSQTVISEESHQDPHYTHVVPEAPDRTNDLIDRNVYHEKVTQWAWLFMNELEERMAQFRDDNWQKGDEQFDDDEIDTEGEEEE